jgi:hypothetical protein
MPIPLINTMIKLTQSHPDFEQYNNLQFSLCRLKNSHMHPFDLSCPVDEIELIMAIDDIEGKLEQLFNQIQGGQLHEFYKFIGEMDI